MAMYMKINGIKGNVSSGGYQDWIELNSLDFNAKRPTSARTGQVTNRSNAIPQFSEVKIVKNLDKSSNPLFDRVCAAKIIPEAEIHICRTDKELTPYAKYVLNDVLVSEHHTHAAGNGAPFETIQLSYTKIKRTYVDVNAKNQGNTPYTSGYDLETAQQV